MASLRFSNASLGDAPWLTVPNAGQSATYKSSSFVITAVNFPQPLDPPEESSVVPKSYDIKEAGRALLAVSGPDSEYIKPDNTVQLLFYKSHKYRGPPLSKKRGIPGDEVRKMDSIGDCARV